MHRAPSGCSELVLLPVPLEVPLGGWPYEVRVLVDGRDLIELVRDAEMRLTWADDDPSPGSYSCPGPRFQGLLGSDGSFEDAGDDGIRKLALLQCGSCGEYGCWMIGFGIAIDHDVVTWSAFEQLNRGLRLSVGPFSFDLEPYMRAVESASKRVAGMWP